MVLQAFRPGSDDPGSPVFVEAFALVEADPELNAWWEAQQAFDRRVAAKLKEVPVPEDLRETILAGRKIERMTPQPQPHLIYWLAAAALVAILCVAGALQRVQTHGRLSQDDFAAAVLPMLKNDDPPLAMMSPDHDKIAAWLKEKGAPMGTLPDKIASLPSVGCQKFMVHGHPVSLVCFAMSDGRIAHLFMVPQDALTDPTPDTIPFYRPLLNWSTASWSDGHMSYLLATSSGTETLKQLL
jgi:hypothetical protein